MTTLQSLRNGLTQIATNLVQIERVAQDLDRRIKSRHNPNLENLTPEGLDAMEKYDREMFIWTMMMMTLHRYFADYLVETSQMVTSYIQNIQSTQKFSTESVSWLNEVVQNILEANQAVAKSISEFTSNSNVVDKLGPHVILVFEEEYRIGQSLYSHVVMAMQIVQRLV